MKIHLTIALLLVFCYSSATVAQQSTKPMRAAGRVDSVTQDSLTIVAGNQDKMSFVIDSATKVIGRGLGTKTRTLKAEGKAPTIVELVKPSDSVVVTYVDAGAGKLRASEVNVRLVAKQ